MTFQAEMAKIQLSGLSAGLILLRQRSQRLTRLPRDVSTNEALQALSHQMG